ncbi:MAG: neutral/alkaline non-lysosomal ceramidase N-terminal domain-containing protein [Planctomycetota bacterium]|jgi:hypothetical protein
MRRVSFFSLKRIDAIVIAFTVCLFLTASVVQSKECADVLRADTAKIDITPKKSVKMAGYSARTGLSTGVHAPLSARVVAFERDPISRKKGEMGTQNNVKRLVLISTDLIGFYNGTAEHLRKVILNEFELKPSELFLSAIHTHAGPSLTIDKKEGHPHNLEYTESLKGKLIEAIRKAFNNMSPIHIGAGIGYSPVGSNRRELRFDSDGNSSIRLGHNPYGPTDKEVLVMKLTKLRRTPDGADDVVVAALFDYAIHATCLTGKNYIISGDVLGYAEQFVEKILGPDVIAPGFAGASGDINPWLRVLPEFNAEPGWIPEPVLLGTMLGEEVVHVFRDIGDIGEVSGGGEIKTAFVTLELPGKPRDELAIEKDCPPTPLNITAARVGDIAFVGIGAEVLTEIGMSIKAASPYKHTFVITHCNGAAGYLPPKHLYIEGGYEIKSSPFAPQAADIVVKQATAMLYGLSR